MIEKGPETACEPEPVTRLLIPEANKHSIAAHENPLITQLLTLLTSHRFLQANGFL
jgi:hypothetical protein